MGEVDGKGGRRGAEGEEGTSGIGFERVWRSMIPGVAFVFRIRKVTRREDGASLQLSVRMLKFFNKRHSKEFGSKVKAPQMP